MNLRSLFIFATVFSLTVLVLVLFLTPAVALFTGHLSGDQYLTGLELILDALTEAYDDYTSQRIT